MALDNANVVDAVGVENGTGFLVLTIADSWDWVNEREHLGALQAKLNAYLNFIESGEVWESCPESAERQIVIDVVTRFPLPPSGKDLLQRASEVSADLRVQIRHRHHPD